MRQILFLSLITLGYIQAQSTYSYTVYKTMDNITVDGNLSEWTNTPSSESFTVHNTSQVGINTSHVKLMWDDNNLYVAFLVLDTDIKSCTNVQDDPLWERGDMSEFILDFDDNGTHYLEIGIDTRGINYDYNLLCTSVACGGWNDELTWDITGMETASVITGTENNGAGDTGYNIELKIPFAGLATLAQGNLTTPTDGTTWKGNFMTLNYNTSTTGTTPTEYLSWSTYPVFGFHQPAYFGSIEFSATSTAVDAMLENINSILEAKGMNQFLVRSTGNTQVMVYDVLGNTYMNASFASSTDIALDYLPKGLYIIQAMNGKTKNTLKFLKP